MKLTLYRPTKSEMKKVAFVTALSIGAVAIAITTANAFFMNNYLSFQSPLVFRTPVLIHTRELISPLVIEAENEATESAKPTEQKEEVVEEVSYITEYDDTFKKYFGSEWQLMRAICKSESGLQNIPSHRQNSNGTRDHGLCQINDIHLDKVNSIDDLYDPEENIRIASIIRDTQGLTAWTVYNTGKYKENL